MLIPPSSQETLPPDAQYRQHVYQKVSYRYFHLFTYCLIYKMISESKNVLSAITKLIEPFLDPDAKVSCLVMAKFRGE